MPAISDSETRFPGRPTVYGHGGGGGRDESIAISVPVDCETRSPRRASLAPLAIRADVRGRLFMDGAETGAREMMERFH